MAAMFSQSTDNGNSTPRRTPLESANVNTDSIFPGKLVPVADTVRSFKAICAGEYDHLPEAAFYMVGTIEEAVAKAETLKTNA